VRIRSPISGSSLPFSTRCLRVVYSCLSSSGAT
jgi:hypothetical protein